MRNYFKETDQVVRRELRRIVRQPMYWVLMVVLPVVSFAFFAVIFERGVARNIPIAVLDEDHTTLSRKVTQMIDDTPTAMVSYEVQSMEEAQRLMREGRISAIVHIPAFFEKNILSNSQTHIECSVSGTNITVNGLLSKDLQTAVTTFQAGVQLQLLMKQGLTEKQAMAQIMPVRFVKHVLFNPYINYSYYLSPSFMPMMLMIFAMLVTIFAIGTELKAGTAREWLDTAGGSVFAALVGKMLPLVVMMLLMTLTMFLILFKIVGVPLNGSLTALLFGCMLFVLAYMAIGVLIVTLLSNLRLSALDRRRLFGAGLHLFGTYLSDDGDVPVGAGVQQDLPLYVLYRHLHRSGASRCTGRRFAVGHGVYRTLHRTADALPAAPAQDLLL